MADKSHLSKNSSVTSSNMNQRFGGLGITHTPNIIEMQQQEMQVATDDEENVPTHQNRFFTSGRDQSLFARVNCTDTNWKKWPWRQAFLDNLPEILPDERVSTFNRALA